MHAGDFHHPIPTKIDDLQGGDTPPRNHRALLREAAVLRRLTCFFAGFAALFADAFLNRPVVADRACRLWRFVAVLPPAFLRISFRILSTTPIDQFIHQAGHQAYSGADV